MTGWDDLLVTVGKVERYCIDSGRPVQHEGDRCRSHGAMATMCATDVRLAECQHPRLSPNHPYPHCSECGEDLPASEHVAIRRFGEVNPTRFVRRPINPEETA